MVADVEMSVKNGAELLDRLLKDIVAENAVSFPLDSFLRLLKERIYARHVAVRVYLVQWIRLLDSLSEIPFISHLPEYLPGLFQFLEADSISTSALSQEEVKSLTTKTCFELLKGLKVEIEYRRSQENHTLPPFDFEPLIGLLLPPLTSGIYV